MAQNIAFLGYNARQTAQYLAQLAEDNAEQVAWYNRRHGRLALTDGTEIISVYSIGLGGFDGRRFDQVILADDRRMEIKKIHRRTIAALLYCCSCSIVPEEFRMQIYDIDEEAPT